MKNDKGNDTAVGTQLAIVTNINDAPKRQQDDVAPLEAFGPQAIKLQGDDWQITTCDGDQVYVFMATKRKNAKTYRIEEVYPGTTKRSTRLRSVKEPKDLVFVGKRHADIADVILDIEDEVLGDFEEVPEGATIH